MKKMLSPSRRAAYAARAPQIAERFSIDRMARQFGATYDRLLSAAHPISGSERKVSQR